MSLLDILWCFSPREGNGVLGAGMFALVIALPFRRASHDQDGARRGLP